ncbi:hypothetical protein L0U85_13325 [Glycomyces sp. L485]|uniref:hypothetical protein n=1 Tax=Glycomyces sp. L485 TaxID=2909235 RepID=UPI001F4A3EB6|nr:hypothetical protein [Glycomyces sp. L485]MCH7231826.1 hypothetical protein [Glycomyces sp. L485]
MSEVAIRLNRLGLERGRMWQAVVAAVVIVLPMALWIGLERAVGDTTEKLVPGETIILQSYPVADAQLQFLPPGRGWSTGLSLSRFRITLNRDKVSATVQVDTAVDSLRRLLDRRAERLTGSQPGITATNVREYRNPVNGLDGYRADLYGRNIAGSIVVVGNSDGAAATVITLAPFGQIDDSTAGADDFVSSFVIGGE